MIFYIGDTHFGHENILQLCDRPFASIEEMNERLIENWNNKVKGADTVYILGDMFFKCKDTESILCRLKGKKHLFVGNHDESWLGKIDLPRYFESVNTLDSVSDGVRGITLCHFPMLTYKHEKKNYMIHGHIHANTHMDFWPLLCKRERVLNAGVDINGYAPVTFDELLQNNIAFKQKWLDENASK